MQVFVTGATGFIGTALVDELIGAGHRVRGLARSDAGAEQLRAAGAEVQRGSLEDTASLRTGAAGMDAVAHLAFGLDMANFAQNAEIEVADRLFSYSAEQAVGEHTRIATHKTF
jgi:uncharacterized protein YbjT (DUF2867 family)